VGVAVDVAVDVKIGVVLGVITTGTQAWLTSPKIEMAKKTLNECGCEFWFAISRILH